MIQSPRVDHEPPPAAFDQRVEWLGLRLRVPRDWEIVRHGVSPQLGRLTFVDRRRERFTLSWTECRSPPDVDHLLREISRVPSDADGARPIEIGAWRGVERSSVCGEAGAPVLPGAREIHLVRYDVRASRLLEAQCRWPSEASKSVALAEARRLVGQIESIAPPRLARSWRAFDLAFTSAPGFRLVGASVAPADTELRFEQCFEHGEPRSSQPPARVSVRRLGMARSRFDGDLERWLRNELSRVCFESLSRERYRGLGVVVGRGRDPHTRLERWLGRGRERTALLAFAESENALYLLATEASVGAAPDPRTFDLRWGQR